MALDSNNFCYDERCERTKRSKKHTVHDVADYNDRRTESIKNLTGLSTNLRKLEKWKINMIENTSRPSDYLKG
jgi:hypothetical protein